jgi:hypothetical protein
MVWNHRKIARRRDAVTREAIINPDDEPIATHATKQ